ncbi:hypothetical protein D3C79_939890 [compost metagenome]
MQGKGQRQNEVAFEDEDRTWNRPFGGNQRETRIGVGGCRGIAASGLIDLPSPCNWQCPLGVWPAYPIENTCQLQVAIGQLLDVDHQFRPPLAYQHIH